MSLQKPIDVPTIETADFLSTRLAAGTSVLEIGCGEGHVAAELERRGIRVTGIDTDQGAVDAARSLGVVAVKGNWPDVDAESADAIAFTRSLHHIHQLKTGIEKASAIVPNGGKVFLEDFAFNITDRKTMDWFLELIHRPEVNSRLISKPVEFVTRMLSAKDPMKEWQSDQHHDLHSAGQMFNAISEYFEITETDKAPYFYRYLVPVFPETSDSAAIVRDVLAEEKRLGAEGEIVLVGRRLVGVKV